MYSTVESAQCGGRELGPPYWLRNLREPVRFFDAVQQLLADGFDAFVEISPHPILLPAVDDAIAEANADAVTVVSLRRDQDERSEMLASLGRLYGRGAAVDWAGLWPKPTSVATLPAYPWQRERFWVDEVSSKADRSWISRDSRTAATEDPRNWLFTPQWRMSPDAGSSAAPERGAWLLLSDRSGRGADLAAVLTRSGQDVWLVQAGEEFAVTGPQSFDARAGVRGDFDAIVATLQERGARIAGIVHMWNIDAPTNESDVSDIEQFQIRGCASVAFLIQALVRRELERPPRIKIVTQGAQSPDGRAIALAQSPVWGLGRVIAEEHPEFWGGLLDLDPAATHATAAEFIARELGSGEVEDGAAQTAAGRHVLRLAVFSPKPGPELVCDPRSSYLVTGGLGAVGLETARWLVERGARHLVLAGRSSIPPRELWTAPEAAAFAERISGIQRLEAMGAVVESMTLDIADAAAVEEFLLQRTGAGLPPIRGIVHAAADTGDCLVIELDVAKLLKVLRPKLMGALLLERATRRMPLDFLLLHSSLGSLLGQPGHPSYAAANAFLDALALDVRHRGRHALAVNWAAWADLGLAQTEGGRRTIGELERRGIRSFSAAAGTEALGHLLAGDAVTAVVAPADWTRFVEASRSTRVPSIVRDLGHFEPAQATPDRPSERQAVDAASPDDRVKLVVDLLTRELAQVLRLPLARIDSEVPMGNLGLESLTALELRKRLETSLGLRLSATVMWNYPTIALLSRYLLNRLHGNAGASAPVADAPKFVTPASTVTTEMSDEEAIRSLIGQDRSSL